MKKIKLLFAMFLCIGLVLAMVSCADSSTKSSVWENAVYSENAEFGKGEKTLTVNVEAEDKTVVFTILTDAKTVGEALLEHKLISGEKGPYGMYVKTVNGIIADYDIDKTYWSFNKDGQYMMTGVDMTEFSDGDKFELVYTKE